MSEKQAIYVGIDLGTSTSALAHVRPDGNPEIVPNADGERLTPSVVFFDRYEGVKLVGSAAKDGGDPDRTVRHIKKHMDDPSYVVEIDGEKWTPTEVSALILAKLRKDCARIIGQIDEVDHRAGELQRAGPQGDGHGRAPCRTQGAPHRQRAHRCGALLRPHPGCARPRARL